MLEMHLAYFVEFIMELKLFSHYYGKKSVRDIFLAPQNTCSYCCLNCVSKYSKNRKPQICVLIYCQVANDLKK